MTVMFNGYRFMTRKGFCDKDISQIPNDDKAIAFCDDIRKRWDVKEVKVYRRFTGLEEITGGESTHEQFCEL